MPSHLNCKCLKKNVIIKLYRPVVNSILTLLIVTDKWDYVDSRGVLMRRGLKKEP